MAALFDNLCLTTVGGFTFVLHKGVQNIIESTSRIRHHRRHRSQRFYRCRRLFCGRRRGRSSRLFLFLFGLRLSRLCGLFLLLFGLRLSRLCGLFLFLLGLRPSRLCGLFLFLLGLRLSRLCGLLLFGHNLISRVIPRRRKGGDLKQTYAHGEDNQQRQGAFSQSVQILFHGYSSSLCKFGCKVIR